MDLHARTHIKGYRFLVERSLFLINILDDPSNDEKIKGDPHKTVFVARLVSNFKVRNNNYVHCMKYKRELLQGTIQLASNT